MRKYLSFITIITCLMISLTTVATANQIDYSVPTNVKFQALTKPTQREITCLTENIYFEAGAEGRKGQIAVALVTMNRLAAGYYGEDVCGVVHQRTKNSCQFSWVCTKNIANKRLTIKSTSMYNDIKEVAMFVFFNYENMQDITKGATYYHADYVNPGWNLPRTIKIGAHIFYAHYRDLKQLVKG